MADSFYANLFQNLKPKPKGFIIGKTTIDLTPAVYREEVKKRELKRRWILGNGVVLVACVILGGLTYASSIPVQGQLDQSLANNQILIGNLGQYKELSQALEQMKPITDKLNRAAGSEIEWATLIGSLENNLPGGTAIKSIGINADGAPKKSGASVRLSLISNSPLGYADTLKAIQSSDNTSNVQIGGMTSSGGGYEFSATLDYDDSILTNRFPSSKTSGGK